VPSEAKAAERVPTEVKRKAKVLETEPVISSVDPETNTFFRKSSLNIGPF